MQAFSEKIAGLVDGILAGETRISYGESEPYNKLVAKTGNTTAVSASGRVSVGWQEVCGATENVSKGNIGESNRFIEYISYSQTEEMCYAVIKSGVTIEKEDHSQDSLCWIITFIFQKLNGEWILVHRHNTRAKA